MKTKRTARGAQFLIGSLRVVRCQVQPVAYEEESVHWAIAGVPLDEEDDQGDLEPPQLLLIGELMAHSEDGLVAVTAEAALHYPDGGQVASTAPADEVLAEIERVGRQIQDILYDTAADAARQLLAMTRIQVDLPFVTPSAEYTQVKFLDDEDVPEPIGEADAHGSLDPA